LSTHIGHICKLQRKEIVLNKVQGSVTHLTVDVIDVFYYPRTYGKPINLVRMLQNFFVPIFSLPVPPAGLEPTILLFLLKSSTT